MYTILMSLLRKLPHSVPYKPLWRTSPSYGAATQAGNATERQDPVLGDTDTGAWTAVAAGQTTTQRSRQAVLLVIAMQLLHT